MSMSIHYTYTKNSVFILRRPICVDYVSPKAVDCCDDNIQHLNWIFASKPRKNWNKNKTTLFATTICELRTKWIDLIGFDKALGPKTTINLIQLLDLNSLENENGALFSSGFFKSFDVVSCLILFQFSIQFLVYFSLSLNQKTGGIFKSIQ